MIYKYIYQTPKEFSNIIMNSDGEYLTGLWFEASRGLLRCEANSKEEYLPIFKETTKWLDLYFAGKEPDFTPNYKINNLTPFRKEVLDILKTIKYGKLITYSDISKMISKNRNIEKMSSQAVGGAVGWNPISIIIPCHRVVGKGGNLIGYGGGINNKVELLKHEEIDVSKYFVPRRGTAL